MTHVFPGAREGMEIMSIVVLNFLFSFSLLLQAWTRVHYWILHKNGRKEKVLNCKSKGNPFPCQSHMIRPAPRHQVTFYWSGYLWEGDSLWKLKGEGEVWGKIGLSSEMVGFALHNEFLELFCSISRSLNGTECYALC